jgi:HlyD family secretion protein
LFNEYLHRGYAFHLQTNIATLSTNVIYETSRVSSGILRYGLILSANLVAFIFIVGSILLVNPQAAMLVIAGLVSSYGAIYLTVRARLLGNGRTQSEEFTERARIVGEGFGAIKELIMLRAQTHFVAKLSQCCRSLSRTIVSTLAITQTPRNALECVTACVLVGAALYSRRIGAADGSWLAQLSFLGMAIYRPLAAECELTDMLAKHLPGRTILLVAHRLSALRHCDLIHELAGGRIVRSATYEQWSLQADRSNCRPGRGCTRTRSMSATVTPIGTSDLE